MKFLIDAQLPKKLKAWLIEHGVEAIHTLDLPKKNDTADIEIIDYAEETSVVIITKDSDFLQYRIVKGIPEKLLIIATGNIVNKELIKLFELNFSRIHSLFSEGYKVVEMDNDTITIHE